MNFIKAYNKPIERCQSVRSKLIDPDVEASKKWGVEAFISYSRLNFGMWDVLPYLQYFKSEKISGETICQA